MPCYFLERSMLRFAIEMQFILLVFKQHNKCLWHLKEQLINIGKSTRFNTATQENSINQQDELPG